MSHMTARALPKPARGTARRARAAKRLATRQTLKANAPRVLDREGYRCRVCAGGHVQVHHIVYRSRGGDHSTGNLVALCPECHRHVHERRLTIRGDANGILEIRRR